MNCRDFQKGLEDYLEGGLDFAGRFAIERHAQQCFGCGKQISDAQRLSQMARQLGHSPAPPDFESSLLNRIQREHIKRRHKWLWLYQFEWPSRRSLATAALGLAAFIMGVSVPIYLARRERPSSVNPASSQSQNEVAASEENSPRTTTPNTYESAGLRQNAATRDLPGRMPQASHRARRAFSTEGDEFPASIEPGSSDYVEYLVPGPGNSQMIVRLPSTIRMRYSAPTEAFFIRNVSH